MSESQNCPNCGFAISGAAFGMLACPNCNEIFMVGGDLLPPIPPDPSAISTPASSASASASASSSPSSPSAPSSPSSPENSIVPIDVVDPIVPLAPIVPTIPEAVSFHDVAEFGNSDTPSSSSGALVYELRIHNVDTSNLRESITECLNDARLGLDVRVLFAKMDKGTLVIPLLNPVKAVVLVGRLKHLPLKITWTSQQLVKFSKVILFLIGSAIIWNLIFPQKAWTGEWGRHEINLKGYQTKISNGEEELRDLIAKKNINKNPQVRDELLKEIIKKNDDLKKILKDMKAEEEHIRFQHPEQGDQTQRKYRHVRLKSLEELENEVGLDGQLSRLKHKVKTKYEEKE